MLCIHHLEAHSGDKVAGQPLRCKKTLLLLTVTYAFSTMHMFPAPVGNHRRETTAHEVPSHDKGLLSEASIAEHMYLAVIIQVLSPRFRALRSPQYAVGNNYHCLEARDADVVCYVGYI